MIKKKYYERERKRMEKGGSFKGRELFNSKKQNLNLYYVCDPEENGKIFGFLQRG
ncbi:MAG: hypothetical protein CM15mP63_4820 [Gammaproteobacteria bacterium]|nr:MAG: hypothetical protein CM15mP63_4820 [Gammaproteobacteria bacterium]